MQPSDRKRFLNCLVACAELYGKQISDAVTSLWWSALAPFDIGAVESAFNRYINNTDTGQFMPKPADILRMLDGTSEEASLVAWSKVDKAVRVVGPYATVAFDDPLIHRVLQDLGGWVALGSKDDEAWPFVANEFRSRYRGYKSRGSMPDYPRSLCGIAEHYNTTKGFSPPQPVLIGDREVAMRVLTGGSNKPAIGISRDLEATVARLTAQP